MRKRWLGKVLTAGLILSLLAGQGTVLAADGQWKKDSNGWWYAYAAGGYAKTGWEEINGKDYWFTASGYMQTGWLLEGGQWYYFGADGAMRTGWVKVGGCWYYLKEDGAMVTGWLDECGIRYYLDPQNGAMRTGWVQIGEDWYFFGGSGAMETGWKLSGGKWYFLSTGGGECLTGDPADTGKMLTSCPIQWKNKVYALDSNGVMAVSSDFTSGRWTLTLDQSGVMITAGWKMGELGYTMPAGWVPTSLSDRGCVLKKGDMTAEILCDTAERPENMKDFAKDLKASLSNRFDLTVTELTDGVEVYGQRQIPEEQEFFRSRILFKDGQMFTIQVRWTSNDDASGQEALLENVSSSLGL